MRFSADSLVPIAVTSRSGFDESLHHGAAVVVDAGGDVVWSLGDPQLVVYPRSACKPLQADAMIECGLPLTPEQLALACASHDGTTRHCDVVRSTLASVGLDESALGNTPDLPLDTPTAEAYLAAGGQRTPLTMNCSGKHAAMVATCVVNRWPVEEYLHPEHPLQQAITTRIEQLAGPVAHIGVDGCGAPAHAFALADLARSFGALASRRGPVWSAMTTHPVLVGGERRRVTRLMQAVPGLLAKDGAEGMFAAGLPDGRGVAVKIGDGAARAAGVVLAAALAEVGVDIDPSRFADPIRGHGATVGSVRPVFGGAA